MRRSAASLAGGLQPLQWLNPGVGRIGCHGALRPQPAEGQSWPYSEAARVRRVKVLYKDRQVEGDDLRYEPINESWNEYGCEDGSTVRVKLVVSRITRLDGERTEAGEPVYVLATNAVVAVVTPPNSD